MSAVFRQHIAHPCAWKAEELRRDPSWIYELKSAEIAEIETALKAVIAALLTVREYAPSSSEGAASLGENFTKLAPAANGGVLVTS